MFTKGQLNFSEKAHSIRLLENRYSHHLYVKVQLGADAVKKKFIVDLGNNGYASTSLKKIQNQQGRRIRISGSANVGLDGENKSEAAIQEIDSFRIGTVIVPDFSVSASEVPVNLLGLGFLENYRTTINWKDKELILEPYEKQNFDRKGFGIIPRFDEAANALIIKAVYEGLSADNLGIQLGAKILSLNGQAMDTADKFCDFEFEEIEELVVELEQEEIYRKVVLGKRVYFPDSEVTTLTLTEE